tara:strand:- start:446 stop:613 length:168 start_codon:yes stop_codon:yes gene_type:complete
MPENIYGDEQKKINDESQNLFELNNKVEILLKEYGYDIEAYLVNGTPAIKYVKVA